jgi:undecaprenyl-diphosphatase
MNFFEAIFLGLVQGLTEFLPVSSSGHLAFFQKIFGLAQAPIFFDTMLHGATLLAVIFYLRNDLLGIIRNIKGNLRLILLLLVATLPAVFVGLFLRAATEESFNSGFWLGVGFLITAFIIYITKFYKDIGKSFEKINFNDSFWVGIFQALSIFSSISRSGATISSAILVGIDRKAALKFSFLLSIPAILGAIILQISDIKNVSGSEIYYSAIGFLPALIFGFLSLKFLDKYIANKKFSVFAYYCLAIGLITLIFIH